LFSPQNTDLTEYLDGFAVRSAAVVALVESIKTKLCSSYL